MKSSDTPSLSAERMRDTQARLQTPYLVLSGHVKPGDCWVQQGAQFRSESVKLILGFLVENYLGIKRKAEPESSGTPKKPKT
ncbi:SART-1 family protein DOT2 [Prunus yedoensis var. nudiflora]|uniref:SART-1 family protein DOT2 n=1 Tax=Prunus yedoensis var. nudiflora TaxID=2094558 RepID=A0A314YLN8_PRUYE|nr:SART-1 family protein DOT2 [Prunus yedoensis var. nudiflora]